MLATLAVRPDVMNQLAGAGGAQSGNAAYDWDEDTAAEQLRQDQCLMSDVLRLGGPTMAGVAQDGLDQSPGRLHALADREHWENTPLAKAYESDRKAYGKEEDELSAAREGWRKPLDGLTTPAGFTESEFHWPPGTSGGDGESFHAQTGLSKWVSDRFWKDDDDFYEDPTPQADRKTARAVKDLGTPLYSKDPAPDLPPAERERALAEQDAFQHLSNRPLEPMGADNARIFLASGGFPRTAPEPGTAEFRIAVEDMKTRFAACAWRDAMDPGKVLGAVSGAAAKEWQQEIASQAEQRNHILDANKDATAALTGGSKALGEMLGQSWIADHLARWQDYWSPGGAGWIGDKPAVIEVHAAQGRCLDVQSSGKTNGTPVQIWPCNGSAAQKWRVYGDDRGLHLQNTNSQKCLDVENNDPANGTKIQIWSCNSSRAQTWDFELRATTALKHVGTGKCLDLHKYNNGYNAWLYECNGTDPQKFNVKPSGHDGDVPPKAQFDKAKQAIAAAQAEAKKQLARLRIHAAQAKTAAAVSAAAEQAAYRIADDSGAPRGRGLLVGQQKAQVTQGAAAALEAMVKAGETAEAATRASGGDSQTIAQRALAQAAQSKAEFRKQAAHTAELQAKAASEAAKEHRDNAKADKETAEAKLAVTEKAEADAKAAAKTAHAKRLAAEAEEATAKKEKETAEAKQADAARHKTNAQAEAGKAKEAKEKAEASESTALSKRNEAKKAGDKARELRDDAWDAEQRADTARTKADAKEAYAQSLDSDDAAAEARKAADAADKHATDAESAAKKARSEADAATDAAADADAAATRAEAAAKRARSDADAAQAAKLKADAAVKTATSAAADAIQAAKDAAYEASEAVKEADKAEKLAKTAKKDADAADKEAAKAQAAAAKAAGYAHVTAQAAVDAGKAAAQVAKPANDAIQIGSPYTDTDSAASLVVLTGQSSKTIAEQQQAVADAHAANADAEAEAAKDIAAQAKGDAKAAYEHAANAASYAAKARGYAKQALGYAADAAKAASKAASSLARTIEYDKQATEDAAAADKAAGRAEGYAQQARDSADQAALDAQAARDAAAEAEQAAKDARAAAKRADEAATEAEQYAKDAHKYAKEAQEANESAQRKEANKQVTTGAGTGIGGTFYVVDGIDLTGDPKQKNPCELDIGFSGCTVTFTLTFSATVSFYLCADPDVPATASGCPKQDTIFLGTQTFKGLTKDVTRYFTKLEIAQDIVKVIAKLAWDILVQDFVDCWHGSTSGCAWSAANFIPGKKIEDAVQAIRSLDRALKSGDDIAGAWDGLRAVGLSDEAVEGIGSKLLNGIVKACTGARGLRASAARGSNPCEGMIAYGSTDLSRMAYQARTAAGFKSGRNVAVARVPGWNDPKTGDLVVGFSKGGDYHSENHILDQLAAKGVKPTKITELYSERSPCSACAPLLEDKLTPGTPISWSVPNGPGSADLLYRMIQGFGGRRLASQSAEQ